MKDFPNEKPLTRMSGGSGRLSRNRSVFFKPHNYRVYYDFDKEGFCPGVINPGSGGVGYKKINSGHDFSFSDYMGCRVVVRKRTIEINNRLELDTWYPVSMAVDGGAEKTIGVIIGRKDDECLHVLRSFIERFGGSSEEKIINVHSENKLMNDEAIDRMPLKMKFHTDHSKKVYNESNIELPTPVEASNYIENRSLERFSPVIAGELEALRRELMSRPVAFVSALESLKMDVQAFPVDVLERAREVSALSVDEKVVFTDWLFETFGVSV